MLTDKTCKQAVVKNKEYYISDGYGLYLKITPKSRKLWYFRSTFKKKRFKVLLGYYPAISLKEAREKRDECLDLMDRDIDPVEYYNSKTKEEERLADNTFSNIAYEWLEHDKRANALKEITVIHKTRMFENNVFPLIGKKNIKDVNKDDILKIIKTKEKQSIEVAERIFIYIRSLFNYAFFKEYIDTNIFSNALDEKQYYVAKKETQHYSKIVDIDILRELVRDIDAYHGMHSIRNALRFVLHLPLRAENLCELKWEHVDFEKKQIIIPRHLMKIKDKNLPPFKAPLTDSVIEILKDQEPFSFEKEWVFLGADLQSPISRESPSRVLQRLGYNNKEKGTYQRLHGFRGTFRSLIETMDVQNRFSFEAKERILDHHEGNRTVRAYSHLSDHMDQLRPMMEYWSEFVDNLLNDE
jgi:integrase